MSVTVSKQEVQMIVDQAKNRVIERLITKNDVQGAVDHARDRVFNYVQIMEQQRTRITTLQYEQLLRRSIALENRMGSLENEFRALNHNLAQLLSQQNELVTRTRRLTPGSESFTVFQTT